jgi:Fic family protein
MNEYVNPTVVRDFIIESNQIEGITRSPLPRELEAHQELLTRDQVTVESLEKFVYTVSNARLRRRPGMNVRVGSHVVDPGGPEIEARLAQLLRLVCNLDQLTPFEAHVEYELLHPFMDGNGRSGRALWAWHMIRDDEDPFALPFLHRYYYQSLDHAGSTYPA